MNERQVVVTGIGAITPIGSGSKGLWEGIMRAESAVDRITRFDPSPTPGAPATTVVAAGRLHLQQILSAGRGRR